MPKVTPESLLRDITKIKGSLPHRNGCDINDRSRHWDYELVRRKERASNWRKHIAEAMIEDGIKVLETKTMTLAMRLDRRAKKQTVTAYCLPDGTVMYYRIVSGLMLPCGLAQRYEGWYMDGAEITRL